jgi:hypothetical protein
MKILDEKKGIGGEYLKGWVGKAILGHICRNPSKFDRDLCWGERCSRWVVGGKEWRDLALVELSWATRPG